MLTATLTDAIGDVLPGVTVVAVHEATGNRFEAVTRARLSDLCARGRLPDYGGAIS